MCENWPAGLVCPYARVLRTERTGSCQSGPPHEVEPPSSLGLCVTREVCDLVLTEALLVCQGPDSHSDLFCLLNGRPTKCLCFHGAKKL